MKKIFILFIFTLLTAGYMKGQTVYSCNYKYASQTPCPCIKRERTFLFIHSTVALPQAYPECTEKKEAPPTGRTSTHMPLRD